MSETLQIDKVVVIREPHRDTPSLLVEWSSPWHDFVTSIKPALTRSEARLAGEAPFGLIPLRIMVPSYVIEAVLIVAAIAIQVKIEQLRPQVVPRLTSHDVIYYSGDELPRTEDLGGAEAGTTGRAGGEQAYHRTQTIRIARGHSLLPKIVDAPNLKLPSSRDAVANLLAVRPDPGPPPAEGLRSARSAPNLAAGVVAPAPNVIRDYTRNGVQLDSVIAPAPVITRDRTLTAPTLNTALIAPAPSVASSHVLVAPALAPAVIPPAPSVSHDRSLTAPSLAAAQVVAPAPAVSHDQVRAGPGLAANVIPPAPGALSRQVTSAPMQTMNPAVIPPPVSAPENANARPSRLALPAPSVVAPPPSADLSHDMRRLSGGSQTDPGRDIVPPPPQQSGSGSFMSSIIGKIFGPSEVVPPAPSVSTQGTNSGRAPSLATNVVPPPPSVSGNAAAGTPHGVRNGTGTSLGSNAVAPPPSVGAVGGTGSSSRWSAPQMGSPNVVPPPPWLPGAGGGTGTTPGGVGINGGTLLTNNVVPPPPSVGGGTGNTGSGSGRRGAGLGAPLDVGAPPAPAHTGGAGSNAGAVISTQPGTKVGLPTNGGAGSLAMSPSGGDKSGLGGSGGGTGTSRGNDPGSAMSGAGTGAATSGTGHGSDLTARGGISPSNGPGGAGNVPAGTPPVRGVDISGGSSIITLPGFGSDPAANDPAAANRRTTTKQSQTLNVVIAATASSGGAFEPYKNLLHGEKYTTYLDTSVGTVVMEFADQAASNHSFRSAISPPVAIRSDLPAGIPRARMVLTCTLDSSGNISNVRVLEPGPASMTAKILSALRSWKFQPAMRNEQPVEVIAILGFGINTDDRF